MDDETPTTQFPAYGPPPGELPPDGPPAAVPPGAGPPAGPTPNRRRRLLLAGAAAVAVVAGVGIGVAVAAGNDDNSSAGPLKGAPSSTTSGSPVTGSQQSKHGKGAKKGAKKGKHTAMRGTITAESGSTWTVKTAAGKSVKVTVTGDTQFGTKKAPATKSDFTVGKQVVVRAAPGGSDAALTARRLRAPAGGAGDGKHKSASPSSSPS